MFVANIVLVEPLGWAITGRAAVRRLRRGAGQPALRARLVIGVVLSVGSWYVFYVGLGIPLPAGILDGIL